MQPESTKILEILKNSHHGMSITEIARTLHKNKHSVGRYLEVLQVSGQVEMRMFGKAKVFSSANSIPQDVLMNYSGEFILILDSYNKILHANNFFLDLTQISRESIIGKNFFFISVSKSQSILDLIRSSLVSDVSENEITTEEGMQQTFLIKYLPIVFKDGTNGIAISMKNITDRKKVMILEKKYNTLLEFLSDSTSQGILIVKNNRIVYANKAIENIFGLSCRDMPLFYLAERIVPEDRDNFMKFFLEHQNGEQKIMEISCQIEKVPGKRTTNNFRFASFNEMGEFSIFLLITNISE